MKNRTVLTLFSFLLLLGCQALPLPAPPNSQPSPSSTPLPPSPMVRPTQYIGWEGDSPAPTPTPIPRTCAELPLHPAIDQAKGLAVSPDGKYVYLSADVKDQGAYLYQVEQGQPIRVLDLSATEVACDFRAEMLEKDSTGHVYLLKDKTDLRLETNEFSIYKLNPQNKPFNVDRFFHKYFGEPNPSATPSSGAPINGYIKEISVDQKDRFYVYFDLNNIEYPNKFFRLIQPDQMKWIIQMTGMSILNYDNVSDKVYVSAGFAYSPIPNTEVSGRFLSEKNLLPLNGGVMDQKIDYKGHLWLSVSENSFIPEIISSVWKVIPQEKRTVLIAGGMSKGYKDGQGALAQFNNPTALDLDQTGNIYVLDRGNRAIRKITPGGVVSTFYKDPN